MNLTPLDIEGVFVIEPVRRRDERGYFARAWCADTLAEAGLDPVVVQMNLGYSNRAGTVRGIHWQKPPHDETKIVRCIRGAVWDVAVDLRPGSPTRGRWTAVELTPENALALYVPRGFGHGYQALADGSEILYSTSAPYRAESAAGARWDDPVLSIAWPLPPVALSMADRSWPPVGSTGIVASARTGLFSQVSR
jgi:dTDP-4-dehydrorhamnose 3,5-epimerase